MPRPASEVLRLVRPLLYSARNRDGERYICNALYELYQRGIISATEEARASSLVLAEVHSLAPMATLLDAAVAAGKLDISIGVRHREYLAFRDAWLFDLIHRSEAYYAK